MSFLLNKKILNVKGDKLNIEYFDEEEICVHGYIVSITYQGGWKAVFSFGQIYKMV